DARSSRCHPQPVCCEASAQVIPAVAAAPPVPAISDRPLWIHANAESQADCKRLPDQTGAAVPPHKDLHVPEYDNVPVRATPVVPENSSPSNCSLPNQAA